MANTGERDGRTQGDRREGCPATRTRHTRLRNTSAPAGHSAQERSRKAIPEVRPATRSLRVCDVGGLGGLEPRAEFPSHVAVDTLTLQKLLPQTERTCLGLLGFSFQFFPGLGFFVVVCFEIVV